jgi:hypothetical protein
MTQGIQHSTRRREFSPAYLARITPQVRKDTRKRADGWFVEALNSLCRVLIPRREDELPDSLIDDVGYGAHTRAAELRSEFNRLDAQLHSRFY